MARASTATVGRGSKPGERRGGRKAGTPNKVTATVKQALTDAFEKRGGVTALVKWANEQPTEFYKLWGRLAPAEIAGTAPDGAIVIRVVRD